MPHIYETLQIDDQRRLMRKLVDVTWGAGSKQMCTPPPSIKAKSFRKMLVGYFPFEDQIRELIERDYWHPQDGGSLPRMTKAAYALEKAMYLGERIPHYRNSALKELKDDPLAVESFIQLGEIIIELRGMSSLHPIYLDLLSEVAPHTVQETELH